MKRALVLLACLLLALTSCAAMLEREYTVSAPHEEDIPPQGDTAYRVESYPALQAALLSYVEEGMEEGLLHCPTTYPGNLSVDLERARRQLMEEEPLGCYALEELSFDTSKIVAYYEVTLEFSYRVDRKELPSMARVGSEEELTEVMGRSLEDQDTRLCVYLTQYPQSDEEYFQRSLDAAAEASSELPLGKPEIVSQELYPRSGPRRVAALELQYPEPPAA